MSEIVRRAALAAQELVFCWLEAKTSGEREAIAGIIADLAEPGAAKSLTESAICALGWKP